MLFLGWRWLDNLDDQWQLDSFSLFKHLSDGNDLYPLNARHGPEGGAIPQP
jgi:hypothetical protein